MTEIRTIGNPVGQMQLVGLGQLAGLGQLDVNQTLEQQYATLRQKCIENYGPDFCNSVMPRNMMYALTRRGQGYTLPWWMWMIAGFLAGKILR